MKKTFKHNGYNFFDERCVTAKRVLVHVRITVSGGVPAAPTAELAA